ncbi:hypothetical protein [Acidaminococcus intestini]|uniref:hypothetical protein n=1 Tax=Acidaminococcus intestini TaxID=187327 RepID=UPI0027B98697|nr:hypothetical protein [Acidaminococcus intestini]
MTEVLSWEAENHMWDEIAEIRNEYKMWDWIAEHGCSDPFWTDGANMNIIRNHIIYYKKQLISKAEEENAPIPQEFYWALPPKVPNTFMVKHGQYYQVRCSNWDKERLSKIIRIADTHMSLF